jgi:hypothetical protein
LPIRHDEILEAGQFFVQSAFSMAGEIGDQLGVGAAFAIEPSEGLLTL